MERLQSRSDILKLIKNVSESCGIKNGEIKNVLTNGKGEGYFGEVFFVLISDRASKKQLNLVIKAAFQDDKVRKFAPIRATFEAEFYAYQIVFPKFANFLKLKGLNWDHYKFVPKCYQISIEDHSEIIILENLRELGFESFDKNSVLDAQHIALIFKTYGNFHGISLAYKEQHPKEFEELLDKSKNNYRELINMPTFRDELKQLIKRVEGCFVKGRDDDLLKTYQKYLTGSENLVRESYVMNCKNSVILHGDCWTNNMMFKYDNKTGKPIDLCLYDFQLMKVGNPACDLAYCLYSGASKENFDKLDDYLWIYYQALSDTVGRLGSDPKRLFSFDDLKNDWKQYAKLGFLIGLFVLKLKLSNAEDITNFTDETGTEGFLASEFDENKFGSMAVDVVRHMYEYGAL